MNNTICLTTILFVTRVMVCGWFEVGCLQQPVLTQEIGMHRDGSLLLYIHISLSGVPILQYAIQWNSPQYKEHFGPV